jgi:predicted amidohydrolase
MRLALAQYALKSDVTENLETVLLALRDAKQRRADLVIYPELCLSPFFPQFAGQDASRYAMRIDHTCINEIQAMCRQLNVMASPNIYLSEGGRCFDASLMIDAQGTIQGVSKMVHIAQVPGFYEQDYYTPSDTGFRVYETAAGKISVVVCFDRHYPESMRTCTLRGAQLIIIPTANRMDEPRDLFEAEIRTAAMQNCVYIAMCNRVGREHDATFCGESIVADPNGNLVAKAGHTEELLTVDLDFAAIDIARRNRPYLQLRRPETYESW